jgi:penicillin-binding protein 1C
MESLRKIFRKQKKFLLIFLISLFLFILIIALTPDPIQSRPADFSKVILDKNGEILRVYLNSQEQWFIPLTKDFVIPGKLEKAVLSYEDKWFYYHPGWNPAAILRAIFQNIRQKRIVSGGSTITMQLARVSYNKRRTFFNKLLELFLTLKLEVKYSKKDILRMYLERAPYGRNIIGIKAASLKYFKKEPEELSWSEAATLAVLPNAPGMISPGKNQQKLVAKKNRLLQAMYEKNYLSKTELKLALQEPVPEKVASFPFLAPHFTDFVKHKTEKSVVHTTINSHLQSDLQHLFKLYGRELREVGIQNCAGIVVETKTGKIRAWVGSQDFFDFKRFGQVDGVTASRSTGSILKPFLYAAAIDEGYILPETLIQDVPTYFKSFSPENANFSYKGLVTAKNALTLSLNIPAVRLLNLYGVYQFYSFLKSAGVSSLFRAAEEYGLTLIIGGAEISLFDLAGLYRGLANYGSFEEIQYLENGKQSTAKKLISEGASFLTLEMLKDLQRPETEMYWQLFDGKQNIAWKTGTSFGHRDAWAAGVTPEWTVCIWAGNFSGDSNPEIRGADAAGSLMFRTFHHISQSNTWFQTPDNNLREQAICHNSGYPASEFCTEIDTVFVPKNAKMLKQCPYHKKIFVNAEETHQVCSLCWDSQTKKEKIILVFPPSANEMLKKQGYSVAQLPPHNPKCPQFSASSQIQIRYPVPNAKIFIPRDFSGNYQKIVFELSHSKHDAEVFWYLDEKYLGSTIGTHHLSAALDAGMHELYVIDENGDTDKVVFEASKN